MRAANARGEALKLTDDELAFYDALEVNDSAVKVLGECRMLPASRMGRDVGLRGLRESDRPNRGLTDAERAASGSFRSATGGCRTPSSAMRRSRAEATACARLTAGYPPRPSSRRLPFTSSLRAQVFAVEGGGSQAQAWNGAHGVQPWRVEALHLDGRQRASDACHAPYAWNTGRKSTPTNAGTGSRRFPSPRSLDPPIPIIAVQHKNRA